MIFNVIMILTWLANDASNLNCDITDIATLKLERPSVTFIMGEDERGQSYYSLAKKYYSLLEEDSFHYLVDTCRSLQSIGDYLEEKIPSNVHGWGEVKIVVHGNPWSGLSTKTFNNGERANVHSILKAIQNKDLRALSDNIVNTQTNISIEACGLGSNDQLLSALQVAFGGFDEEIPKVRATENFVTFLEDEVGMINCKSYKPFYAFYRTAYQPPLLHLKRDLAKRYPKEEIDWLKVLSDDQNEHQSEFRVKRFNLPMEWSVSIDENTDMQGLEDENLLIDFIKRQKGLMAIVNEYKIPIGKFRWLIHHKERTNQLVIKGKATVLCVLREKYN